MTDATRRAPADPEPTLRGVLAGAGATPLAFARWEIPDPRGRVVISHGYGEHGERYRHVAAWLNGLGWAVSTLDHQGFGRSGGVRGDARGIRVPVADLAQFLRQERLHDARNAGAANSGPARPQILLGHSYGGLVALLVLLWHPDTLEGAVLSSPALALRRLSPTHRALNLVLRLLAPHRPLEVPGDKGRVCSDPEMVRRYWEDPLCHRFVTAGFLSALAEGRRELLRFGAELDRPILLLEAGRDTVVDPDGAQEFWASVRPGLLERHRLEPCHHEIFHDLERGQAESLTQQWLERNFSRPAGTPVPQLP